MLEGTCKKQEILTALLSGNREYVSGEDLSALLGISRASVWKHVQRLRKDGFTVHAVPNRGYILKGMPDEPYRPVARKVLRTECFGKRSYKYFESVTSTNTVACSEAENGAPEGSVYIAGRQTNGRGRFSRRWESPEGGVYFSLILRPDLAPAECGGLSMVTALTLTEALKASTGLDTFVKWPNDILLRGGKIAGVLTEMRAEGDMVDFIVTGVGINVNTPQDRLPEGALSVYSVLGARTRRVSLFSEILERFEKNYFAFKTGGFGVFRNSCRKVSATLGERVEVDLAGKRLSGTARDIDETGALIITDDEGRDRRFVSGEITMKRPL